MKKQIAAAIMSAFILTSITACKESEYEKRHGDQESSAADNSTSTSAETPSSTENESNSNNSSADSEPVKEVRAVYGETEIPDGIEVPPDGVFKEGDPKFLESMVFDTCEYGGYTFKLIGEDVRTNKKTSPGKIFVGGLSVEVEKDGVTLGEAHYFRDIFSAATIPTTLKLYEDKIGDYISFYNMDIPVFTMKYYFSESSSDVPEKAMMFATIEESDDGMVHNEFFGVSRDRIGVTADGELYTPDIYESDDSERHYRAFIFGSEKLNVVDGRTLVDEEAGIKYTFDFSKPIMLERYTAEKVDLANR